MCGVTPGGRSLEGIDVGRESVLQGTVLAAGDPVAGAYVRLLDDSGEFTAELPTSATGTFRFFAAPGHWTLRALSSKGTGEAAVEAQLGAVVEVDIAVAKPA